jgi:hypothetical protein
VSNKVGSCPVDEFCFLPWSENENDALLQHCIPPAAVAVALVLV